MLFRSLCNNDSSRNLSVPGSAVLQKDGKACVFVYNPSDSKVHSREVTLPLETGGYTIEVTGWHEGTAEAEGTAGTE